MQRQATATHRTWAQDRASDGVSIENIARVGYVAKGIVYGIIAWLAVDAAFNAGGRTTGTKGALAEIVSQTHGQILLVLVAVGLAAYAFWRIVQSVADTENEGSDLEGVAKRVGYFVSGLIHASLVVWAGNLIAGSGGGSQEDGADSLSAALMSVSYGQWLVGAVGAIVIGVGIQQFTKGYKEKFKRKLRLSTVTSTARKWIVRSGKAGLMARGVVFWIIGGFFIVAAYRADPSEAKGLGEALRALEQAPYGPYLLGAVGVGLLGYAAFQLVSARYRSFPNV